MDGVYKKVIAKEFFEALFKTYDHNSIFAYDNLDETHLKVEMASTYHLPNSKTKEMYGFDSNNRSSSFELPVDTVVFVAEDSICFIDNYGIERMVFLFIQTPISFDSKFIDGLKGIDES